MPRKWCGCLHRLQRIDRGRKRPVRAVLEADRGGQAARHLPVRLRLGGTGTDRGPGDELGEVLRHDGVERFGSRGKTQLGDVQQQLAREQDALLDVKRIVQVRIVDQPLPAHRGSRLLEVHAHDQQQRRCDFVGEPLEALAHTRAPPSRRGSNRVRRRRTAADRAAPGSPARFPATDTPYRRPAPSAAGGASPLRAWPTDRSRRR